MRNWLSYRMTQPCHSIPLHSVPFRLYLFMLFHAILFFSILSWKYNNPFFLLRKICNDATRIECIEGWEKFNLKNKKFLSIRKFGSLNNYNLNFFYWQILYLQFLRPRLHNPQLRLSLSLPLCQKHLRSLLHQVKYVVFFILLNELTKGLCHLYSVDQAIWVAVIYIINEKRTKHWVNEI